VDWHALRDDYPTLGRTTYLNSCSLGCLSNESRAAHARFFDEWTDLGASAWYELWLDEIAKWRVAVARLVGARPEEVAWTYAVATSLGTMASCLNAQNLTGDGPYAGRADILAADKEFPSTIAAFGTHPQRRIDWIQSDGVQVPAADYETALTPRHQAVVASRVFYATGALQDVAAITRAARANGSLCIVDDYHGLGQVPLDFHDAGLDVLVGGPLKWVCGGPVSAWMVVRKDLIKQLTPTHAGWWADETMFDFDMRKFRLWQDARRFEQGTVNLHGVFTSRPAVERIAALGPERIRDRVRALAADLEERLEDAGWTLRAHPDPAKRTGIVMVEHDDEAAATRRLAQGTVGAVNVEDRPIIVDHRPGAVRVSPHFYNTFEENERIVAALAGTR
jgi:selenocysteine lyase/cysteine desulfurase